MSKEGVVRKGGGITADTREKCVMGRRRIRNGSRPRKSKRRSERKKRRGERREVMKG